jgi:hypothetical protein
MASDSQILIEIVLEDGSVQKGFAKIKQEAQKTSKDIGTDFKKNANLEDALDITGLGSKFKDLGSKFTALVTNPIALGLGALGAAALALKATFDETIKGEKLQALDNQFRLLAGNANIASSELRKSLEEVSNGLINNTQLIEATNKAILELGSNAEKLPEILSIANKLAQATGKDALQTYDELSTAIAKGNQRSLASLGIIVDLDKAYKDYADSIGLTVGQLEKQDKQLATLAAVSAQAEKSLSGLTGNIGPATTEAKKLANAVDDFFDIIATKTSSVAGPAFASLTSLVTTFVSNLNKGLADAPKDPLENAAFNVDRLTSRIEFLKNTLKDGLDFEEIRRVGGVTEINREIQSLTNSLEVYKLRQSELTQNISLQKREEIALAEIRKENLRELNAAADVAKQKQLEATQTAQGGGLNITNLQLQLEQQKQLLDGAELEAETRRLNRRIAEEQFAIELANIEAQKAADISANLANAQAIRDYYDGIEAAATTNHKLRIQNIENAANEERRKQLEKTQKLFQIVVSGTERIVADGLSRIGASLIKGQAAFDGFAGAVLNTIGDMMINLGIAAIGIGNMINSIRDSLTKLFGGNAIAAGAAMIVAGGAIKAIASSLTDTASSSVANFGGFGGGTTAVDTNTGLEPIDNTARAEVERRADTSIVVNLNGDILGDEDSGERIVSLINTAFDKKGVVVRQGVFA